MIRLIGYIFITITLMSCQDSEQNRIARLVNEWNGKIISFPDSICLTSYRDDTVITKYVRERSSYTILNYVDTIGCVSCRLQLLRWKDMMKELDSIYPSKVNCLMVFYPKGKNKLIKHLRNNQFDYFVCIDKKDTINKMNKFINEEHFCTFLLNKDDKIMAIGNPILNPNIKKLYYDIVSGKEIIPRSNSQSLTSVSLSKDDINLGEFLWKKEQEVEVTLSNIGKNPLVINDVVTSCGCMVAEFDRQPVSQKQSINTKIVYKAEHPKHFDKTITIYCNTKDSPFKLKVTGNAM